MLQSLGPSTKFDKDTNVTCRWTCRCFRSPVFPFISFHVVISLCWLWGLWWLVGSFTWGNVKVFVILLTAHIHHSFMCWSCWILWISRGTLSERHEVLTFLAVSRWDGSMQSICKMKSLTWRFTMLCRSISWCSWEYLRYNAVLSSYLQNFCPISVVISSSYHSLSLYISVLQGAGMCGANVGNAGQLRTAKAGAIEEASSQASEPLVLLPDTGLHGISRNLTKSVRKRWIIKKIEEIWWWNRPSSLDVPIPVVPHKAVAEVSKIGNL